MSVITTASAQGIRESQEDRFAVVPLDNSWLLAVLDGHNGDGVSDLCAKRLPTLALEAWERYRFDREEYCFLRRIIQCLHEETMHYVAGSTISLAHIIEECCRVNIAVLGDSPVLFSPGNGMFWVSNEHNILSNIEDRRFVESRGALIKGPYMSVPENDHTLGIQLTRTLGDTNFHNYLIREPECSSMALSDKSVLALMSDGVYDKKIIRGARDLSLLPIENAESIIDSALKRGTRDNVTAVVWRR